MFGLEDRPHGVANLGLGHERCAVDHVPADFERHRARAPARPPCFPKAWAAPHLHHAPRLHALPHHRRILRPASDNLDRRLDRFQIAADAADQSAAPDRHEHRIELRHLPEQFDPDGPLPGHDSAVVVRRDEDAAGLLGGAAGREFRRKRVVAGAADARAMRLDAPRLGGRDMRRDKYLGRDAAGLRSRRHAESVIAVRRGDNAGRGLRGRQHRDLIGGAAEFERPGRLQVLELEPRAELRRIFDGRLTHDRPDALVGAENLLQHHSFQCNGQCYVFVRASLPCIVKSDPRQ